MKAVQIHYQKASFGIHAAIAACLVAGLNVGLSEDAPAVGQMIPPLFQSGTAPAPLPQPRLQSSVPFDHGNPTDIEQYMLELVNRARANPGAEAARLGIDLNQGLPAGTIQDTPKQPLGFHPYLIDAARNHSQWMLDNNIFSHTGETNSTPGNRMENAGYPFASGWAWGENIAWLGTTGSIDVKEFTENRHEGLFKSPGHRRNLMNGNFDEVGIGNLVGAYTYQGEVYNNSLMVTQNFAQSGGTPGPLILGVLYRDANTNGFYDPGEGTSGITVTPASGNYHAVTSPSGGYAFPYSGTGEWIVTFSGGELSAPVQRTVQRSGINVKQDLELNSAYPLEIVSSSIEKTPQGNTTFVLNGPPSVTVVIQSSPDFLDWTNLSTNTMTGNPIHFVDDTDSGKVRSFYRLIQY